MHGDRGGELAPGGAGDRDAVLPWTLTPDLARRCVDRLLADRPVT
ncbi:hypothetical protein AB0H83_04925 [Dactylosporangium sp. NPDC050688]